ncbi:carboxypeptidase-like regulatory domain-containing protein [Allomuricauda sp. SCSIO 65647]|uniref:carboxypeptidase-like regulatory domain-containing protein n=1 Tax=Allomuricauda sp. SCSIO 65647 TaxID=2908843 RepID=UPI001F3F5AB9|nr:carboxypeptidase-like regulatory domain-containing protein [Muricauda sp. SCSIO 65647]UJH67231.1 carboxypeptidase-like regulatory domain-containing protein [Muricauda sp. SCSIO 65647]
MTFSGKVVDEMGDPLPFSHLVFEGVNIGTISNEDGLFKLVCSSETAERRLVISLMGYHTKKIYLSKGFTEIILAENVTQLAGVTLTPKDYGKELIERAINAIPDNYPMAQERHRGFLRETTEWDDNLGSPIYIAEAVIESIKKSYQQRERSGEVKLIEFRKYESGLLDSLKTRIHAGSHHAHRFDVVHRREGALGRPSQYAYKIIDTLRQGDKSVYNVFFEKKGKLSGNVFIQDSSYAIVKANYKYRSFFDIPDQRRQFLNFEVSYEQGSDGLWRYKYSHYETGFRRQNKQLLLTSTYVTSSTDRNNAKIPYLERMQFNDILLEDQKEYKADFWRDYNIILPDEKFEALFAKAQNSNNLEEGNEAVEEAEEKVPKLYKILRRISHEISFFHTLIRSNPYTLNYNTSTFGLERANNGENRSGWGIRSSLLYEVGPNLHVGYVVEGKIFKTGVTSHDLVITKAINLNPKGRPIIISPELRLGHQQMDWYVDTLNTSGDFTVKGTSFDSDRVAIFLSERVFRAVLGIQLAIEKSNTLHFFLNTGFNFPFSGKMGVLLKEKDGFFLFRKKAFLENNNENLVIRPNTSSVLENTCILSAGLRFSL